MGAQRGPSVLRTNPPRRLPRPMQVRQCHRIRPGGVEKGGHGPQGGLGNLGEDGGLLTGLVPQDLQVERVEQAGFEGGSRPGRMSPTSGSSSSRVGSAAFGVTACRASSWAWACSRWWWSSANRVVILARIAAAAVSAGSDESCSRLRIWAFWAVSICLSRVARAAAWASRSAAASAAVPAPDPAPARLVFKVADLVDAAFTAYICESSARGQVHGSLNASSIPNPGDYTGTGWA
jgi:hypothetical protein